MIRVTVDIEENHKGIVSVHTQAHAIGTVREAIYAKAIIHATELAQKLVSESLGGELIEAGDRTEIIRPIGEG